jgi:hypothetical protein
MRSHQLKRVYYLAGVSFLLFFFTAATMSTIILSLRVPIAQNHDVLKSNTDTQQRKEKVIQTKLEDVQQKQQQQEKFVHKFDDLRPLWVTVAHQPRPDQLGSFVLPTFFMLAIAARYGWSIEILPYKNSIGYNAMKTNFELRDKVDKGWGSGLQDANFRPDFDPAKTNEMAYETLNFFPKENTEQLNSTEWTDVETFPPPGPELNRLCHRSAQPGDGFVRCRLWLPNLQNKQGEASTVVFQNHIQENGGIDAFFTDSFRNACRRHFLEKNQQRLTHFKQKVSKERGLYHVAMHIRRGDILDPNRWIDQSSYATVGREICRDHPNVVIHVFSSGRNRDGGWTVLEKELGDACREVVFHLDGVEFDDWAHFVAADALVISKSSYSYVPALFASGDVYFPASFWHLPLAHWKHFKA